VVVLGGSLTFEQVKKARVFAWHERFYFFANDTLLRVVTRYPLSDDVTRGYASAMAVRPSSLRGTEHLLDDGWHHLDDCSCPYCSPRHDEMRLGFEQVTTARVFAWHERHCVFTGDALLRVVARDRPDVDATRHDPSAMLVRPSSLRGTEHLLDDGWRHLDDCSCAYCAPGRDDVGVGREEHDRCRGPGR
jgi:hypothetical protein